MAVHLKDISELHSVSGNEAKIREYIKSNIKADEIFTDTMGNLVAFVKGKSSQKKLAVVTHMDESGFIVSDFTDKGYIKFKNAGNIEPRTLISKRVVIDERVMVIIGMKAIHLQTADERKNVVKIKDLFIDIGAKDKDEAKALVNKGDYICFDTEFKGLGGRVKGKALDRSGVYCVCKAMENPPAYDTYFVFTVQKEIGSRGAMIISHRLGVDFAVLVDTVESADMYGVENRNAAIDGGAVIDYANKRMISDKALNDRIFDLAKEKGIKIQKKTSAKGEGDYAMQYGNGAKKCISINIPIRYANTPVELMSLSDVESVTSLLKLILNGDDIDGIIE